MARTAYPRDEARGGRLKYLREKVRYADQKSAAEDAGVSMSGLRKWEKGGEIEAATLQALARSYGANPRWIMEGEGDELLPTDHWLDRLKKLEERVQVHSDQLAALLPFTQQGGDAGPVPSVDQEAQAVEDEFDEDADEAGDEPGR